MTKPRTRGERYQICTKCNISKPETQYYVAKGVMFSNGRFNMCKDCVKEIVDIREPESVKDILKLLDRPFLSSTWFKIYKDASIKDPFGRYIRMVGSLPHLRDLRWGNSELDIERAKEETANKAKGKTKEREDIYAVEAQNKKLEEEFEVSQELYKKWGRGFKPDEILDFEDMYAEWIGQYQVKTPIHETFLKDAIIASVRKNRAMAAGDIANAEKYSKMFKETTAAGKLAPSTMSKDDLSDGIDTFGEMVKRVEEAKDAIEILPKFKSHPRDKADWTIYCYLCYVRELQNLPKPTYEEIYKFYEEKKKEFAEMEYDFEVEEL